MIRVMRETVRSLLRGKLLWICFVCALLVVADYVISTSDTWQDRIDSIYGDYNLHKSFYNWAAAPGISGVWLFAAIICSVDILRDRKNGFSDLRSSTGLGVTKLLCGKVAAYLLLSMLAWAVATYGEMIVYYIATYGKLKANYYTVWQAFYKTSIRMLAMGIPITMLYISISLFAAVYGGMAAFGILASVVFANLWLIPGIVHDLSLARFPMNTREIYTWFGYYILPVPGVTVAFWYFRNIVNKSEELTWAERDITAGSDYAVHLLIYFGICAALLIAAGIRIKKGRDI